MKTQQTSFKTVNGKEACTTTPPDSKCFETMAKMFQNRKR